jgi:hypothetical protein
MNNRNACKHWANRLGEARDAISDLEAQLREMAGRDPADYECAPLLDLAQKIVEATLPEAEEEEQ